MVRPGGAAGPRPTLGSSGRRGPGKGRKGGEEGAPLGQRVLIPYWWAARWAWCRIRDRTGDAVIVFMSPAALQEMAVPRCRNLLASRGTAARLRDLRVSERACPAVGPPGWWPQMPPLDSAPKPRPPGP